MIDVNYLAIFIAAVANIIIGMIWYSPKVFGKQWMHAIGMKIPRSKAEKADRQKEAMPGYVLSFIAAIVMAYVISVLLVTKTPGEGVLLGFWVWLGFVATVNLAPVLWEKKSWRWYYISAGHYLISLVIMGAIIGSL
jgi:hypothetical protein